MPTPPRAGRGRELTPEEEDLVRQSERSFLAQSKPTSVNDPSDPVAQPWITPDIPDPEPPPVVAETGGAPQTKGEHGQVAPGITQPEGLQASPAQPQVDTSQTMEAQLASQQEAPIAQGHEDTRLQQEASEQYLKQQAGAEDVQQLAEGIEERAPSGWEQGVDALFGEGGEAHQALRSLEDQTNGLITVPGAPGAGFGTDEYWNQVGWNAAVAAAMEGVVAVSLGAVPLALRKGAYALSTPKATRQAASSLRTAANEAHAATLQYQALRGGKGTEKLLRTERAGDITGITPAGMHPAQAVRTPTGQMGPMTAETSAAFQQMTSAHHTLARAVDKVDGFPSGWTLNKDRWMGIVDDLMLHRGGTPFYFARPGIREVLARTPGSRTMMENMPRSATSFSSSQASRQVEAAHQRMLAERARHQQVVSGMDEATGPYVLPHMRGGKPGTPATTTLPTSPPPSKQLSYKQVSPAEREGGYRYYEGWAGTPPRGPLTKTEDIYSFPGYSHTARPGPMRQHEQFVERSWQQAQRATKEYEDLARVASERMGWKGHPAGDAPRGLELLHLTLGKGKK